MKRKRKGDYVHEGLTSNQERLSLALEEIAIAQGTPMMSIIINTGSANYEQLQKEIKRYCLSVQEAHVKA